MQCGGYVVHDPVLEFATVESLDCAQLTVEQSLQYETLDQEFVHHGRTSLDMSVQCFEETVEQRHSDIGLSQRCVERIAGNLQISCTHKVQ